MQQKTFVHVNDEISSNDQYNSILSHLNDRNRQNLSSNFIKTASRKTIYMMIIQEPRHRNSALSSYSF